MDHPAKKSDCKQIRVLFIDDQPRAASDFADVLIQNDISVKMCGGVQEALSLFNEIASDTTLEDLFEVVILDVMMNVPAGIDIGDHRDGMDAGACLFHVVREALPSAAIIFLTNRTFNDICHLVDIDEIRVRYLSKLNTHSPSTTQLLENVIEVASIPPWSDKFTAAINEESYSHSESPRLQALWSDFVIRIATRNTHPPGSARCSDTGIKLTWEKGVSLSLGLDHNALLETPGLGAERSYSLEGNSLNELRRELKTELSS